MSVYLRIIMVICLVTRLAEEFCVGLHLYSLAEVFQFLNMGFTCPSRVGPQLDWISKYRTQENKGSQLIQRETYLKEEIASLRKGDNLPSQEEELRRQSWEQEVEEINQLIWEHQQELRRLHQEKPRGAWIRAYEMFRKQKKKWWKAGREYCKLGGGCCSRNCGCCEMPRKTDRAMKGEEENTHCTVACGCCVRNRGFYKMDLGPNIQTSPEETEARDQRSSNSDPWNKPLPLLFKCSQLD
jgi:hypothetical protein